MAAKAGHAGQLAIEANDGAGAVTAAGTFAVVAGINADIPLPQTRNTSDGSAHGDTIDSTIVSALRRRGGVSVSGNLLVNAGTQDAATGLEAHYRGVPASGEATVFGMQFQGPDFVLDTTDDIVMSGALTQFDRNSPFDANPYAFTFTFMPSGPFKQDGAITGITLQP